MITKLELINAAQSTAKESLNAKDADLPAFKKDAFAALAISKKNWQFFSDYFEASRSQYSINSRQPIEYDHPLDQPEVKPTP
jgi:hypothetical protein